VSVMRGSPPVEIDHHLMRRPFRVLVGRATWNLTDQAISSVTNAALALLIARFADARTFAAYAVSFTLYSLFVGGMRALVSEPLAVRFSRCGRAEYRDVARAAVGGSLMLGAGAGMLVVLVGASLGDDIGGTMIVLGLFLPALLAQDTWRAVFIVRGRPSSAALNDSAWAIVQLGVVGWMLYIGVDTAPPLLAGWGSAAVVAALLGIAQIGAYPQPARGVRWLARQADLSRFYLPQFLAVVGSFQLTLLLVGVVGTVEDVGSLRAALVLLGPLGIIGFSAMAFAVPELSRHDLDRRRTLQAATAISLVLVLASVLWSAILLALPTSLGSQLLGDTWGDARTVLPGMVVWQLGTVAVCGASAAITAKGWARTSFRISAILAPTFLLFGLVGTRLAGATGAAAGMALAQWAIVPIYWTLLVSRTAGTLRSASYAPGSWPQIAHRVADTA
jgi:O-antigen/teichoic acid export membrane protein